MSLSAQSIIKDFIRGVSILLETRFGVGDTTQVGNVSRRAEQLTLRATYVRDAIGGLVVVPNGKVRIVANQTKDGSSTAVDVTVVNEENLEEEAS